MPENGPFSSSFSRRGGGGEGRKRMFVVVGDDEIKGLCLFTV